MAANGNSQNLPDEILVEILKRLPVKSICRLRSVCKLLLRMIDSPLFTSMHSASLISANNSFAEEPHMMIGNLHCGYSILSLQFVIVSSQDIAVSGRFTSSEALSITQFAKPYAPCFCFNNLLCLKNVEHGGFCFLYDPFKADILTIPDSNPIYQNMFGAEYYIDRQQDYYGMGFDKINNTYKIIRLSRVRKKSNLDNKKIRRCSVALVHVLGTSSWRETSQKPPFRFPPFAEESICAYGDMYWVFRRGNGIREMWSFDFTKEEFYSTPHPATPAACNAFFYYITLKGCLAVVNLVSSEKCVDIWILKDYDTKEWRLDYRIIPENHVLDHIKNGVSCGLRSPSYCGEWEHGIYFVSRWTTCYFFDLRNALLEPRRVEIEAHNLRKHQYWRIQADHRIFNLRRTFISLKQFENSVDDPNSVGSTGHYTVLDFCKKYF